MTRFLLIILFFVQTFDIFSQNFSLREIVSSVSDFRSGKLAESLLAKNFSFIEKHDSGLGSYNSEFAYGYDDLTKTRHITVNTFSWNMVSFVFASSKKAIYDKLITGIKSKYKKECFGYSDAFKNYITSYTVNEDLKIYLFSDKGEDEYQPQYYIVVVKNLYPVDWSTAGDSDKYNNGAYLNLCKNVKP